MYAVTIKELRHISRDARIFFLVVVSPAFLLLILAYVFSLDVNHITLAWLDGDQSALSRDFLASLTADGTFQKQAEPGGYAEAEQLLQQGQADVVLSVPPGFQDDILAGRPANVWAEVDGSDGIFASQAAASLAARATAYDSGEHGRLLPAQIRTRAWYNGDLKSLWSMVPGLLSIVLVLPALALTLAMGREKEIGTLEVLVATPVRGAEYQLGKVLAYTLTGLISVLLAVAVAVFWFHVPMRGSLALFLLLTVDFYMASMGISLLVAHFMASQQTAMLTVLLIFFVPGFFVSGLITPIREGSLPALLTSYALPMTHFIAITRSVFLKGTGPEQMALHVALLTATALVSLALSLALFRKRMG